MSKVHEDNAGYVGVSYEETQDPFYSYNKLSLPLAESDKTVVRDEITVAVTVTTVNSANKYVLDGTVQATASLLAGNVYTFDQSHSSNTGHPLRFSYTADGTHGGGQEYTLGVTTNGTPGQSGAYTKIVVPFGLHNLKYYCSQHPAMGGSANVVENKKAFTVGRPILKTTDAFGKTLGSGNNADPYAANLVLAIPMNGSNNGTTFTDVSNVIRGTGTAKSISVNGAKTVTNKFNFYGSSGYFDGNDYLELSANTDFALGDGDFTIELWVHPTDLTNELVPIATGGSGTPQQLFIGSTGAVYLLYGASDQLAAPAGSIVVNAWQHIAVSRKGGTLRLFINGVLRDSASSSTSDPLGNATVSIGRRGDGYHYLYGWMQDLRIYKGVAKYVTPFPSGRYGMDVVNYTGNQSNRSFVLNHQPDLVWIKAKSNGFNHQLYDSVRGINNRLNSNLDAAQGTAANSLTAFNSNGFSLGSDNNGDVNGGGPTDYVAWTWRAGGQPTADNAAGLGQAPTSGSVMIDGVVSTSAQAGTHNFKRISASNIYGFSIVKFEGTDNGVYPTGLQTTPDFIIYKDIDAGQWWRVYHSGMTNGLSGGKTLYLNQDYDESTDNDRVTAVTSNTFTVGNVVDNDNYIAYIWSEREGFSKFGTFSHNGSSGQTLDFGFKPRWWLVKEKDGNTNWYIFDATRDNFDDPFFAETAGNASSGWGMTFSGTTVTWVGGSFLAGNYIYAAFAESAAGEEFESHIVEQLNLDDLSGNSNNASNAGATWQTTVKKFYDGASGFLGGTNTSRVTIPSSNDFVLDGDFTIETWLYLDPAYSNSYRGLFQGSLQETGGISTVYHCSITSSTINFGVHASSGNASHAVVTTGAWHHIAIVRSGNTLSFWVNGSPAGSATETRTLTNNGNDIMIGQICDGSSTRQPLNGYLQDFRWYKGIAKYSSSFSPPERSVQGTARRHPSGIYVLS